MVGVLTLAVLFLSFSILAQLRSAKKNQITFQTSTGATVLLTIDDIKRDIASFKELDPSSDEKSLKYSVQKDFSRYFLLQLKTPVFRNKLSLQIHLYYYH